MANDISLLEFPRFHSGEEIKIRFLPDDSSIHIVDYNSEIYLTNKNKTCLVCEREKHLRKYKFISKERT
jgi:hypothetical protein